MDGSPPKANRKVRFSLPEPTVPAVPSTTPVQKQRMSHGTVQYVNGTLISHQAQQTHPPSHSSGQSRAHQSLQVTPTPTSLSSSGPGCTFKPKELNNKIVLHLRPSVSSLDQGGGVDLPSPKTQPPGASIDGGKASSRQKPFAQKPTHGVPAGSGGGRSLKSLPQINQKFPSSEDVNNNVGATMGGGTNRQKSSDDLSSLGMWNHPAVVKKPTIILRTISGSGIGQKSLTGRARSKSGLGKLPASGGGGGSSYGGRTGSKTLISPHLQPMETGGVLIRVQENCTTGKSSSETNGGDMVGRAGATRSDEINVSSIIRPGGAATNSSTTTASTTPTTTTTSSRSYGKANQFLAVPEYSDRYEGMETVVSATLPDEEEEEDEEEDDFGDSEQDGAGGGDERQRTAGRSNNGSASDDNGEPKANGAGVGDGDDASFRCTRDTNLSRDRNTAQFWDFVERWRTNRALKKLENANHHPHHQHRLEASNGGVGGVGGVGGSMSASIAPVPIGGSIKSDAKRSVLRARAFVRAAIGAVFVVVSRSVARRTPEVIV
uniref:Uncharacterized protein n=1 Tax=Anopheles atroparvus TaxID=41427 RepID=A0AAG5DBH0_ANOAO